MNYEDADTILVEGYLQLLDNLSPGNKLDLISRLTESVKGDLVVKKNNFRNAFGAFQSDKTAEEIIEEIRGSRWSVSVPMAVPRC